MVEQHGWYRDEQRGRVVDVLQWSSPTGVLVGIRPWDVPDAPGSAPPLSEAFAGIPVRGMPECPKAPEPWRTVRSGADCW